MDRENMEIREFIRKSETVLKVIEDNEYELSNNYDEFDWLKIYGDAITKHGLDMRQLLNERFVQENPDSKEKPYFLDEERY